MKKWFEGIKEYGKKHPYTLQFLIWFVLTFGISILLGGFYAIDAITDNIFNAGRVVSAFFGGLLMGMLVVGALLFPIVVTVSEAIAFLRQLIKRKNKREADEYTEKNSVGRMLFDFFVIFIGVGLEILILEEFHQVQFFARWTTQLYNMQLHAPINSQAVLTFVVISLLYVFGMLVLTLTSSKKRTPLITVLCISAMYVGVVEVVVFTIQVLGMHMISENGKIISKFGPDLLYTLLIPLNMILIMLRVMLVEIKSYVPDENRSSKIESIPILRQCNRILTNSKNWPILALLLTIPLLGIVIAILTLFGQAPDAAIKAFTETADYTFSTKIPPQNLFYDEHYLCTVAAGGHRKIVKPIRMGKRHGHAVVVNRQLMIANAFEQILEERVPKLHKPIRNFYDKYGFPVAGLIKTKIAADAIWFVMKPLEWLFLIIIYLVDVNPEDRIERQYL